MWVTKLLISPVKNFFAQKRPNLAQNWHFWSIWARPCRLIQCPAGGSVGGCGARAVSRKTPIYFMLNMPCVYQICQMKFQVLSNNQHPASHRFEIQTTCHFCQLLACDTHTLSSRSKSKFWMLVTFKHTRFLSILVHHRTFWPKPTKNQKRHRLNKMHHRRL